VISEGVRHPGKLVRGRLAQTVGSVLEVEPSSVLRMATAIEYFHLASLLLDDLPCMDDADLRRGRPCAHKTHGEAGAILGALAFINRAYALMGFVLAGWPRHTRIQAQAGLDACLGWAGLVGGQARDLAFSRSERTTREVGRIAVQKTTSLLWLSALVPALAGFATPVELRALRGLCLYWGLAFQGLDDLRDLLTTSFDAGKSTGRDRVLVRPNLALHIGVPEARRRITHLLTQSRRSLDALGHLRPGWSRLEEFQRELEHVAAPLVATGQEAA